MTKRFVFNVKGVNGQSHYSEINVKLVKKNEFVTHVVQKCIEMRKIWQNVVSNVFSGALGNRSEIVRILVLAMTTVGTAKMILNIYICTKNEN